MTEQDPATLERKRKLDRERWRLVRQIAEMLDGPMTGLAFVWLVLLILDFTQGLSAWLVILANTIWILFILYFLLEFVIAPKKLRYLRRNWLTAIALVAPALRVFAVFRFFRLFRFARAARPLGLLRVVSSLNRGMHATRRVLQQNAFGYVVALTILVTFTGAAGMYRFERPGALVEAGYPELAQAGRGLTSYGEAVWWTAMLLTTMGSEYWPRTSEGRFLCWMLAIYGFALFGYITATIATFFLGPSPTRQQAEAASRKTPSELAALRTEILALRAQVAALPGAHGESP